MPINVIVCNCNGRLNKLIDVDLLVKKLSREKTVGNVCVVDNLCKGEIKETLPSKEPVLVLACSPCKNTRLPLVLRHFLRGVSFEVVDVLGLVNSGEPREVTTLKALSIALAHIPVSYTHLTLPTN